MHPPSTQSKRQASTPRRLRAFTLLELMVTLSIIVIVLGFLASALGRASQSARQTASQRSVEAIAAAVEQFRLEFGFLPPLVHDGQLVSTNSYRPIDPATGSPSAEDGPLRDVTGGVYDFQQLVVWSQSYDFDFFRRRDGNAADSIALPTGGNWDIDSAWDDRRYSRYALAYYLVGILPRSVDGIAGQGMTRPLPTGGFSSVGYPVGSTRDRFEPTVDTDRRGLRLQTGYARPIDLVEHGLRSYQIEPFPTSEIYALYDPNERDQVVSLVDSFGTAYRYYRWEHGRYDGRRRLAIDNSLDLNIPPILLDPEVLVELQNDDTSTTQPDLTNGNLKLRQARFAIVGAGADRLFGTEPIEYIIQALNIRDPAGDQDAIARARKAAMLDNVVAFGK